MGKAPSAPDPYATSAAQTKSNQQTANYNADLNRVSQYTPYGSSVYSQVGTGPSGAPMYRQDVTLDPLVKQNLDNQFKQDASLSNIGFGLADQAKASLNNPITTNGLPGLSAGGPSPTLQTNAGGAPGLQTSIGNAGPLQRGLDYSGLTALPDPSQFNQAASQAADAAYTGATARLDPQYGNMQSDLDAKLANQGVVQGSDAYNRAQSEFGRQRDFAYGQARADAFGQGLQAQQQGYGQALSSRQQGVGEVTTAGNFANAAQAQQFGQNANAAGFYNDAANQGFQNRMAAAGFGNSAQSQMFGQQLAAAQAANQARAQGLQERSSLATMPLNWLNALRSSTQVQNPTFGAVPQSQAQPTDVSGNIYRSYQADAANSNNFMNGLFSLGSAAIMASDRRLKRDIKRIGETKRLKLPWYEFRYAWDPIGSKRTGVMAQDVLDVRPEAVLRLRDGYLAVDYGKIA